MKIENSVLDVIAVRTSQYPADVLPEFLLVGRSNVGKSSFINTVLGRKNYAKTSATPGKTQTLNFYLCNNLFYIVDVPGYGYAYVDKATQKKLGLMIEEYLKSRKSLVRVFLLVDSRMKPTDNDILMYNYLKYFNLPTTIIATKFDKIKAKDRDKVVKTIENTLNLNVGDNVILFSNVTKKGKDEVLCLMANELERKNRNNC